MKNKKLIFTICLSIIAILYYLTLNIGFAAELLASPLEIFFNQENNQPVETALELEDEKVVQTPDNTEETEKEGWKIKLQEKLVFQNTTTIDTEGNQMITNYDSIYVLVNKKRMLPSYYQPNDLIIPSVPFPFEEDLPRKYMRKEAAKALESLFEAATEDNYTLFATSGYRSYERQKSIFQQRAAAQGEDVANRTSARPGQSEHQTGLAMDVTTYQVNYRLTAKFGETKEGIWLAESAHRYGFIIRYPKGKEQITGYSYEPWHLRYVGEKLATYLYENHLTLEEYFIQEHDY
ncbi:D-alanyl-D-alanine carboxypeptidase [Natronincola peptidivorans]|uniref:D-alanyl-D-alanine carboxypeptidase n=1 Tax=Natronincola peptidivorans TaxID=426128 RepID=A0A1I0A0Q4_9FIRM|nr:M15 family metallopeptidase [Natronincola peptidivorans]SES87604.1 D-alanyl-D-alanine carboxypeptidase [Natronincola peptidivorans]